MLAIELPTLVFSALSLIILSCIGGGHIPIPNNNLQGPIPNNNLQGQLNTISQQMSEVLSCLSQIENMLSKTISRDDAVVKVLKEQTEHLRYMAIP